MSPKPRPRIFKNIGPKTQARLHAVGVMTLNDLQRLGSVEVYVRIKRAFPKQVSIVALYALEAAILDVHWNALPRDVKADLRASVKDVF